MEVLWLLTIVSGMVYILLSVAIQSGLGRRWPRTERQPQVTVMIAARNEAGNLPSCLDHLAIQEYDHDRLQVLVLNDQSVDETGDIAREYANRYTFIEYHETVSSNSSLKGKMNVLAQGVKFFGLSGLIFFEIAL